MKAARYCTTGNGKWYPAAFSRMTDKTCGQGKQNFPYVRRAAGGYFPVTVSARDGNSNGRIDLLHDYFWIGLA